LSRSVNQALARIAANDNHHQALAASSHPD